MCKTHDAAVAGHDAEVDVAVAARVLVDGGELARDGRAHRRQLSTHKQRQSIPPVADRAHRERFMGEANRGVRVPRTINSIQAKHHENLFR